MDELPIMSIPTGDPVVDRGDLMIDMAEAVDKTRDENARNLLLAFMEKVYHSITLPPRGQLIAIDGGKEDAE